MPATPQYHVVLDGQGYLIDPASYKRRPAQAFAVKQRTGDARYADLSSGAAWAQTSWVEGVIEGSQEYDAQHPTRSADTAAVDISFGDLRLGRAIQTVFATEAIAAFSPYNGTLYAAAKNSGKVYQSTDGSSWTLAADLNTISPVGALTCILGGDLGLYVGGNVGKLYWFDGTTWALYWDGGFLDAIGGTATSEQPTGVTALAPLYLPPTLGWGGNDRQIAVGCSTYDPTVPHSRSTVMQMTERVPVLSGFVPQNRPLRYPRIDVLALGHDDLFTGASDATGGLRSEFFSWNSSNSWRSIARRDDNAVASLTRYRGTAYAGSKTAGKIWSVDNSDLTRVFALPEVAMGGAPPAYTKPLPTLAVNDERLYFAANDAQGLCLWQFDGTGWCRWATGGGAYDPNALAAWGGAILVATNLGIARIAPTYASVGWAKTPWFDADLGSLDKAFTRVTLTFAPLPTGATISVDYALDDGTAFTALGMVSTTGAATATFAFPTAVHARRIQLRYTLSTTNVTVTPQLRGAVLEYQLLPTGPGGGTGVKSEFVFDPLLEGTPQLPLVRLDRSEEPKTGAQLRAALWAAKGKPQTLTLTDTDGSTHTVWFADLEDHLIKERDASRQGWRGSVRLVEA